MLLYRSGLCALEFQGFVAIVLELIRKLRCCISGVWSGSESVDMSGTKSGGVGEAHDDVIEGSLYFGVTEMMPVNFQMIVQRKIEMLNQKYKPITYILLIQSQTLLFSTIF